MKIHNFDNEVILSYYDSEQYISVNKPTFGQQLRSNYFWDYFFEKYHVSRHSQIKLDKDYLNDTIDTDDETRAKSLWGLGSKYGLTDEQKIYLKMKWNFT